MKIYKFFPQILIGLGLFVSIFFGFGSHSLASAAVDSAAAPAPPGDIQVAVDTYLKSIPSGYYTVGKVEGLKRLLKKDNVVLIDVREPSEYASGHIANAINIPLRTLTQNLDQIPKAQPVVLYCSSGYRSGMAVMSLHLLSYDNVRGFPPSINGWKVAGEKLSLNPGSLGGELE